MAISKQEFMKLQNGSDIRGIACEGIEGEHTNLTAEVAYTIGQAFARWLMEKKHPGRGMYYRCRHRLQNHRTFPEKTDHSGHPLPERVCVRLRHGIHSGYVHVHCLPGNPL